MLVGRHVAWDRREELAAYLLRIGATGHVPHEGAADASPLLVRLDAEQARYQCGSAAMGARASATAVANAWKRANASAPHVAPTARDPAASRSSAVTVGCVGEIQQATLVIGVGVTQTSQCVRPMRSAVSSICGAPAARCPASGKA